MGFPLSLLEMVRLLQERWVLYGSSIFVGFWGSFGWYSLNLPVWLYLMVGCVSTAAGIGLIYFAIKAIKGSVKVEASQASVLLLYSFACLLALSLAVLRFMSANAAWPGFNAITLPQGRFLFPVILAVSTLFMLGMRELVPVRYRSPFLLLCVAAMAFFDFLCFTRYVIPYFYG
jgi:hypothetical protein